MRRARGIIALTKWVAKEYGRQGIRAIQWHRGRSNQRSPSVRLMTPQGRLSIGWASRMRSPRRSLLPTDGAAFTTGQILRVDGRAVMS